LDFLDSDSGGKGIAKEKIAVIARDRVIAVIWIFR